MIFNGVCEMTKLEDLKPIAKLGGIHGCILVRHIERYIPSAQAEYANMPGLYSEATVADLLDRLERAEKALEWHAVTGEWDAKLMKAATKGRQILAYQDGRFYNAWLELDECEGGWVWMDEDDSEPSPTHWAELPAPPALSGATS